MTAPPRISAEAQTVIDAYVPKAPEAERQLRELTLVVAFSVLIVPALLLWVLVAWLTSANQGVITVGEGLLGTLMVGVAIHLARYYDALIGKFTKRERPKLRWPRRSGDLDLIVQLAAGVLIGFSAW